MRQALPERARSRYVAGKARGRPNAAKAAATEDAALAIPDLSVAIAPTAENGCGKPCWAVSHLVATTSKRHLHATLSRVTPEQLSATRRQIALAVGIEG